MDMEIISFRRDNLMEVKKASLRQLTWSKMEDQTSWKVWRENKSTPTWYWEIRWVEKKLEKEKWLLGNEPGSEGEHISIELMDED
jgi:hypothetical protein